MWSSNLHNQTIDSENRASRVAAATYAHQAYLKINSFMALYSIKSLLCDFPR
jgi:hypothetical protein